MSIRTFEQALAKAVAGVRAELADANINSMGLTIECEGRTMEGEIKITFSLGKLYDTRTKGDTLDAVTTEFLRRNGWQRRHDSLRLSHSGQLAVETNPDNSDD